MFYTIRKYKLPEALLCGFCHRTKFVTHEIHFKGMASREHPKGIKVDICDFCFNEHNGDFSDMELVADESLQTKN